MRPRALHLPLVFIAAATVLVLTHAAEVRDRSEVALGRGAPPREAALARGFVLGEDDAIDAATVEDFRRAGLSHLLAVSGQNVALLALLAMPLLAALGMPLRTRLLWLLGLIAVYVPLAGAGPSIQRAAIMGGLSVLATLGGRRASRFYALALAALVLLALEPRIAADVGWQLSFAAVLGILLLAGPLRTTIADRIGDRGWRRALADGAAMTTAATLATAPLIAFHFEAISMTTLFANLLALPAVAPAMWLGMLTAVAGQVPGLPVEPLGTVNALLLAYIAQVATWCGRPSWAYLHVHLGLGGLVASYAALAAIVASVIRLARRRRIARLRWGGGGGADPRVRLLSGYARQGASGWRLGLAASVLLGAFVLTRPEGGADAAPSRPLGLRVYVFDVGQGDAMLLQPRNAPALLVDGGPPGDDLVAKLRDAGVERLGAVVVTHDQSDHAGGIFALLGRMPIDRLLFGKLRRPTFAGVRAAGVPTGRLAAGGEIRSGRLRIDVLWPPRQLLREPLAGADPNHLALVLLARWRRFSMLLTADAEAESTPLEPGSIDVLKVAHHGSDDAGLGALLDRTRPSLAVISVGEENPFGHPTPTTLATLAEHGVRTLRTDRDGTIVLDVGRRFVRVARG
jgi:competence protein ComEC